MNANAAGMDVRGCGNPNWKGGLLPKICEVCRGAYSVKRASKNSRFCSLQCVGIAQRGGKKPRSIAASLICAECRTSFTVPAAHAHRYRCCSVACRNKQHAKRTAGEGNANWRGGLSRKPYPWNFRDISRRIIDRDGGSCQNPGCAGTDQRLTAHHINYQKHDCCPDNLITLCSACNSKANFGRDRWQKFYQAIIRAKKNGGGWETEEF